MNFMHDHHDKSFCSSDSIPMQNQVCWFILMLVFVTMEQQIIEISDKGFFYPRPQMKSWAKGSYLMETQVCNNRVTFSKVFLFAQRTYVTK